MATLFWISLALVIYTYLAYPLCLAFLKKGRPQPVGKGVWEPDVSIVLAASNEEANLGRRLTNLRALDYPAEKLQIVVVSDGSVDGTVAVARQAGGDQVKVISLAGRQGKAAAVNAGVEAARGEIVLFCDARQLFEKDVVRQVVANFADPAVGCVSGELLLHSPASEGGGQGMGAYWRYEKWIRKAESASGSTVGATGAIYAIRRCLYRHLPHGALLDDVIIPMRIAMQGYRVIFDGTAFAHDTVSKNLQQEWVRKVRTLAGNWQMIGFFPQLLLPWRNPCCWRFLSHKVLRLLVPVALVTLMVSSLFCDGLFFRGLAWMQGGFYGLAGVGRALPGTRRARLINLTYFFVVMNAAAVAGFWRWAAGRSASSWQPAYQKGAGQ